MLIYFTIALKQMTIPMTQMLSKVTILFNSLKHVSAQPEVLWLAFNRGGEWGGGCLGWGEASPVSCEHGLLRLSFILLFPMLRNDEQPPLVSTVGLTLTALNLGGRNRRQYLCFHNQSHSPSSLAGLKLAVILLFQFPEGLNLGQKTWQQAPPELSHWPIPLKNFIIMYIMVSECRHIPPRMCLGQRMSGALLDEPFYPVLNFAPLTQGLVSLRRSWN